MSKAVRRALQEAIGQRYGIKRNAAIAAFMAFVAVLISTAALLIALLK